MTDFFYFLKNIESEIIEYRRELHKRAEVGFELKDTVDFIKQSLLKIGCEPNDIGKCGVYTIIGKENDCDSVLLRADIDALPMKEESGEEFSAKCNMHACGHDIHASMMLGAARVLKANESMLNRPIKLLFQPAEEILEGARNMIENGILEHPHVSAAFMLHVMVNIPLKSGSFVVSSPGISAPGTKYFEIEIRGRGCHGAMPNTGIDPINAAAHIITMLDSIKTRELSIYDNAVLTVGSVAAGNSHNVIPDVAKIQGTFRAFDDSVLKLIEDSMIRICKNTAKAFRCEANISFPMGAPSLYNDETLSKKVENILINAFSEDFVITSKSLADKFKTSSKSTGSEDFAYYSKMVPSLMIGICAGSSEDGYTYPLHYKKVRFDESALIYGAAALSEIALKI